jgi:hypothetical protein
MQPPYINPGFSHEPKSKSWFLSEQQMRFLTAAMGLAGVLIGVFGHQRKEIVILLIVVPGVVLLLSILPAIWFAIHTAHRRLRQKGFVNFEYPRLQRLYERLITFTDQNNGRSLRQILYSASAYRHDTVDRLLGSDYIWTWVQCYGVGLNMQKPRSLLDFLRECNELTAIISEYNRQYAHKTQKGMEQTPIEQEHVIDQLEQFRDDFNHYLREVEEWATGINASAMKLEPNATLHIRIFPCTWFEKVKTFRKTKEAKIPLNRP